MKLLKKTSILKYIKQIAIKGRVINFNRYKNKKNEIKKINKMLKDEIKKTLA